MAKRKSFSAQPVREGWVYREGYDDGSLIVLVDRTVVPRQDLSMGVRSAVIEDQIQGILKAANLSSAARSPASSTTDIGRTLYYIGKNGLDTMPTFVPSVAKRLELEQLECIDRNDGVVLFFHGYFQSNGSARRLLHDAKSRGLKLVSVGYDYRMEPAEFADLALLPAIRKVLIRGGKLEGIIGHSTGADNLRYALIHKDDVVSYGVEQNTIYILSAPLTNGFREPLNIWQHLIRGIIPERDDARTARGKEQLLDLNHPLPTEVKAYTFLCAEDRLVPPHCGLDTNSGGLTVIIPGGGHFAGTGVSSRVNEAYLDHVKEGNPRVGWGGIRLGK